MLQALETRPGALVARINAVEAEAVAAIKVGKSQARPEALAAKHHVALAGIVIGGRRSDDQITDAVVIDVPGAGDAVAADVTQIDAVEAKAVVAIKVRKIEACPEALAAEHHIALAAIAIGIGSPDDHIIDTVAIDVAGARDREAAPVASIDAVDAEAIAAVEGRQTDAPALDRYIMLDEHRGQRLTGAIIECIGIEGLCSDHHPG